MRIKLGLTAKILGEIIAKGMSLSEIDLNSAVDSKAIEILEKIDGLLGEEKECGEKLAEIERLLENCREVLK